MKISIIRKRRNGQESIPMVVDKMGMDIEIVKDWRIPRRFSTDILIRWGSTVPVESKFEINTIDMIKLMNNKPMSRRILQENGISVPKTYYSRGEIFDSELVNYPLIGREKYHSQGLRMFISNNLLDVDRDHISEYWSEFIPKDTEYRVYVLSGRVLGVSKKIPNNPEEIAWNNSTDNSLFETVKWKYFPIEVCKLALKACEVLKVDFSAVDIMCKGDNNYVLELNTAPSMSEYRANLFARGFKYTIKQIETTGQKPLFSFPDRVNWKTILHPALLIKDGEEDED